MFWRATPARRNFSRFRSCSQPAKPTLKPQATGFTPVQQRTPHIGPLDLVSCSKMETILHVYHPKRTLCLLEYANKITAQGKPSSPPNVLLFVGGLYDNFRWPRYVDDLAALFPRDLPDQQWRVMHVQLSSNQRSWGLFDLDRDVSNSPSISPVSPSVYQPT